jgi:UDP-2,4-diacetamido-2,4,6-trideoxy-beta-L-altropyranose hydrolase
MRCLTLADALVRKGAETFFICRELEGNLCQDIAGRGHRIIRLPLPNPEERIMPGQDHASWLEIAPETDASQVLDHLSAESTTPDWLVVDHYALDASWEKALRGAVRNIMVIDDLADRAHDCDLLLDQNLYPDSEHRYDHLVPSHCEKMLGPSFALLRPEFGQARKSLSPREGKVRRMLMFFGSSDPTNETCKALNAIHLLGLSEIHVDVIVGFSNPHREDVEAQCNALPSCSILGTVSTMAELMAQADLFIGAGGSTTWERFCLGLPSLVIAVAGNQVATSSFCAESGTCLFLGRSDQVSEHLIAAALETLLSTPETLRSFSRESMKIVDGKGVQRVLSRIAPPEIILRKATMDDCDVMHLWRNHEETRRFVFNPDPIPIDVHREWFKNALVDSKRIILIGEGEGVSLGVLRYDLKDSAARVSIYLAPDRQGKGMGVHLLRAGDSWIKGHLPHIETLEAEILPLNKASLHVFEQAGFRKHHLSYHKVLS